MSQPKPSSPAQLVGLMIISVLLLALTGLFGIWYSHETANSALTNLGDLTRLIDSARQAQVEFKIQVQHWKNLLIRGQNPDDLATYTRRFDEQNALVQKTLQNVQSSPELPAELKPELDSLVAEHASLLAKYHAAAARYSDASSISAVDQSVRGIDQKLNDRIDAVAVRLVTLEAQRLSELRTSGEALYRHLRLASLVVGLVAIACAGLLAWRSLRPA